MQKLAILFFLLIVFSNCKPGNKDISNTEKIELQKEQLAFGFFQTSEPNEEAFSFLVPEKWLISGGITRVNSNPTSGRNDQDEAKLYLRLSSPDAKSTFCWLPNNYYFDSHKRKDTRKKSTEKNAHNLPEMPLLSPVDFGVQIAFPFAHPHAHDLKIIESKTLEKVAEEYRSLSERTLPEQIVDYMAASVSIQYVENGITFREDMICVIENFNNAGYWGNKDTWYVRSSAEKFSEMSPVFSIICKSVRLNPRWIEKEVQYQQMEILTSWNKANDLSAVEKEIYEQRIRVNSSIASNIF